MARDQFIDLRPGGLGTYSWAINHAEEDEAGISSSVQRTASVSGFGYVRQIGEPGAMVLRWKGVILQRSQLNKFWGFFGVTNGLGPGTQRTIELADFQGAAYEILFTSFQPVRERVAWNPRAEHEADRQVKWNYTAEFEVIRIITILPD